MGFTRVARQKGARRLERKRCTPPLLFHLLTYFTISLDSFNSDPDSARHIQIFRKDCEDDPTRDTVVSSRNVLVIDGDFGSHIQARQSVILASHWK